MKKNFLLLIGPLLLLTGCGGKKNLQYVAYTHEPRSDTVLSELDTDFEDDRAPVRSFFEEDSNEFYAKSEFVGQPEQEFLDLDDFGLETALDIKSYEVVDSEDEEE